MHCEFIGERMNEGDRPKRLKLIACEILYREVCLCVAHSPNVVDVAFMSKGLHDLGADEMRARLQAVIDEVDREIYSAILLGYGLCNNGTAGLVSPRLRMVIPRAHDCITLFLGSKDRYREYFDAHPGTYYRTTGWFERSFVRDMETLGDRLGMKKSYEEYVREFGEENARFIWESLRGWEENYRQLTWIGMGLAPDDPYARQAKKEARERGWEFDGVKGNLRLIEALVDGAWNRGDFLVLEPGERFEATNDERVIEEAARSECRRHKDPGSAT